MIKTKNGEEKTPAKFLVIKVDSEIIGTAKLAAVLEEVRKSRISGRIVKRLESGKIRSDKEFRQEIDREHEKLQQKLMPMLSEKEYPSYVLYSNFKGEFQGIVPFTPEIFDELRTIGRNYVDEKSRRMKG
jgi:hypothetical protein